MTFICFVLFFFIEEHGIKPPGRQREPGGAPAQEETLQGPQWSEPGVLQEQSPATAFRPGEQPPASPQARQEEEETPQEETRKGESQSTLPVRSVLLSYGYVEYTIWKGK